MAHKTFEIEKKVRMQHCDPGGVVFTPQYFNLFVEVLEDWFADALRHPFSHLISQDSSGTPAMRIEARFHAPSKLGDTLAFRLHLERLRSSTALIDISARCANERCCSMKFLYGFSRLGSFGLTPWPDVLRERMGEYLRR
ncbi:MAG: thioesterase [Spirochaetae bacterium HGW-Spirochaetae-10]|nr:MAG: thioesterase [Spirochaetae bacterium HGW-Spirochaetae-10]